MNKKVEIAEHFIKATNKLRPGDQKAVNNTVKKIVDNICSPAMTWAISGFGVVEN